MIAAGLVRDTDKGIVGGVCAGIGRKFNVDPWAVRALFVLGLMLLPGSQLLVYPVAWLLMPDDQRAAQLTTPAGVLLAGQPASQPGQQTTEVDNGLSLNKN